MEVDDWPTWERQLILGPYIHHCSCVYDHCADVLQEAIRYIPQLQFERFGKPSPRPLAGEGPGVRAASR